MSSIFDPAVPAGAYDEFLTEALPRARSQRVWEPADGPLPALYLSHGAPPLFDDGPWLRQLFDWAQALPRPRSVLIVSAMSNPRSPSRIAHVRRAGVAPVPVARDSAARRPGR